MSQANARRATVGVFYHVKSRIKGNWNRNTLTHEGRLDVKGTVLGTTVQLKAEQNSQQVHAMGNCISERDLETWYWPNPLRPGILKQQEHNKPNNFKPSVVALSGRSLMTEVRIR